MRTCKYFKYLVAMIIALNTSANVFAQQRNLKIYFNEYATGETAPRMLVTDDNNQYGVPLGVTVSQEGAAWAGKSRFFEWVTVDVTDRVIADFVSSSDKKHSKLKLEFTSFPYEINTIQWNVMNDLLSGSVSNWFQNYNVTTKCVPVSGNGFSYTEEHWSMNIFTHSTTFNQGDIPWQSGATLNGLKSFEISEKYETKIGIGGWTWWDLGEAELSDKNRTFIKAGWNGKNDNTNNITDSDDSNWAFKVKFTLPEITAATYTYDNVNKVHLQPDNYVYVNEVNAHAVKGYISAHAGAVDPTYDPTDQSDFHFEYFTKNTESNFAIGRYTGAINKATAAGDYPVVVKLMRAGRFVCSTEYTVHVSYKNITSNSPVISIGFADGKKGYDVSVGDVNAQIKGFIEKNANGITPTENASGYHFEYSEASNGEIITINNLTGDITPKKEGDVQVTAVLKNGNTVISNPYTYTLHVFARHEGLEFRRINTYKYTTSNNKDSWKISNNQANQSTYEWNPNNLLSVNASLNHVSDAGANDWKQIAGFSVNSSDNWRAICQEIAFDIYVPKYTKASARYTMAGNAAIGNNNEGNCRYGFELFYVNQGNNNVSLEQATTWLRNRTWDTKTNGSSTTSSVTARWATNTYHSSIGDYGYYSRSTDNASDAAPHRDQHRSYTVYFAAMAYLGKDHSYPGDVSFGFKAIPEYTYYTTVTYYMNDGTTNTLRSPEEYSTTKKDSTIMLFKNPTTAEKNMLKRDGYEFLGWSTNPNATTAEYEYQEWITVYDNVDGGGRGPLNLYAVWKPNDYIVELWHDSTPSSIDGYVCATYGQAMPLVDIEGNPVKVPTSRTVDFNGYYRNNTCYYDKDMKSNHIWDRTDNNIIASWKSHETIVHFDFQGGAYGTAQTTATYGQAMPTGLTAPSRTGYTFDGYYTKVNGKGAKYYNADMTGAKNWTIDERFDSPYNSDPEAGVTLYAKWTLVEYIVTLDHNGGAGENEKVIVFYNQQMPSVDSNGETLKAPTRDGYMFLGYTTQTNGGDTYYSLDWQGNLVSYSLWPKAENGTLYAQWEKIYKITLDADGGTFDGSVSTWPETSILEKNEGSLVLQVRTNQTECAQVYCSNRINIKPGYKLLGWYTKPQNEGEADQHPALHNDATLVYRIDPGNNFSYHFYAVPNTANAWDAEGKWVGTSDLTLYAHYEIIFGVEDDVVTFLDMDPKNCVSGEDLTAALDYAKNHGTQFINTFDMTNPDTGADGLQGEGIMKAFEDAKAEAGSIVSPNALVLFTDTWPNVRKTNAVTLNHDTGNGICQDLVVTDRYSMRIPVKFNAQKASYARDAGISDKETEQAQYSIWGTLCLPYPVKNKTNGVKYYWLQSTANDYMEFEEYADNAIIPANTPVLYKRTEGESSKINISENYVDIPKNISYTPVTINYADLSNLAEGTYPLTSADESIHNWEFRGNLKTSVFCGRGYVNPPADATIFATGEVYYFKQNKFTHLLSKRVIDGKTYAAGKMNLYPYRAYFYQKKGSGAKISAYSILVSDEDGTLDITDMVFGDGEGDGKIYDLNGIRVMQPVKGRLYIVNGKKKIYR